MSAQDAAQEAMCEALALLTDMAELIESGTTGVEAQNALASIHPDDIARLVALLPEAYRLCNEARSERFHAAQDAPECTYCGEETSSWPSTSCEEPLQHDRATYVCDCGEELTVASSIDSGRKHRRCHEIDA